MPPPTDELGLAATVKEDLERHDREWSTPGFQALVVHRFGTWAQPQPGLTGKVWRKLHRALFVLVRNFYGIELPAKARLGRRLLIGHQHGIVVDPNVVIGDDCVIRHNVTIGSGAHWEDEDAPRLGNHVAIGPGAVIIGAVRIGDGVRIGPNALVTRDVPAGSMVFEKPTRVVQLTKSAPATSGPTPEADTAS